MGPGYFRLQTRPRAPAPTTSATPATAQRTWRSAMATTISSTPAIVAKKAQSLFVIGSRISRLLVGPAPRDGHGPAPWRAQIVNGNPRVCGPRCGSGPPKTRCGHRPRHRGARAGPRADGLLPSSRPSPRRRHAVLDDHQDHKEKHLLDDEIATTQARGPGDDGVHARRPEEVVGLVEADRAHRNTQEAKLRRHAAEDATPEGFHGVAHGSCPPRCDQDLAGAARERMAQGSPIPGMWARGLPRHTTVRSTRRRLLNPAGSPIRSHLPTSEPDGDRVRDPSFPT